MAKTIVALTSTELKMVHGGAWANIAGAVAGAIGGGMGTIVGHGRMPSGSAIVSGAIAGGIAGFANPIRGITGLIGTVGAGVAGGGGVLAFNIVRGEGSRLSNRD